MQFVNYNAYRCFNEISYFELLLYINYPLIIKKRLYMLKYVLK